MLLSMWVFQSQGRLLSLISKPDPNNAAATARWLVSQNFWGVFKYFLYLSLHFRFVKLHVQITGFRSFSYLSAYETKTICFFPLSFQHHLSWFGWSSLWVSVYLFTRLLIRWFNLLKNFLFIVCGAFCIINRWVWTGICQFWMLKSYCYVMYVHAGMWCHTVMDCQIQALESPTFTWQV